MHPIDELKKEHREIERMLRIVTVECDRIERGDPVDSKVFAEAAEFFRNYADRYHHEKEEKLLFEKMVSRGLPRESGPIRVMMSEHDEVRAHLVRIAELAAQSPTNEVAAELLVHARQYIVLLSDHIRKEDGILYPIANDVLTNSDQAELKEQFAEVNGRMMGQGEHERYHRMIEKREKSRPPKRSA